MEAIAEHRLAHAESVWLEVLSRHRDVAARYRLAESLIVGRGYDNDVILDDPYVAPRHLRVFRDESGDWIAEDLGSANGLFAGHGKQRQARVTLTDDSIIRIGQTYLRLRRSSHAVPPERVLQRDGRTLLTALAAGCVALALTGLMLWLGETGEPNLRRYLVPLLTLPLVVLGWTGIWALLTKIFSGHARFERHLLIAVSAVLVSWLIEQGGEFLVFATSWPSIATYDYVAVWLLSGVMVFLHLWTIGPAHLRLKGGLVAALMIVGIAIQSLYLFDGRDRPARQETRLLPPAARLVPVRTGDAFFADVAQLRTALDRDRERAADDSDDDEDDEDDDDGDD
jgi:hypothetical protein